MKETLKIRLTLLLLVFVAAPAFSAICPMRLVFELARRLAPAPALDVDGNALPPLPTLALDTRRWGMDVATRDRVVEAFLRRIGRDELRGIFLIGSDDAFAGFVVFVQSRRDFQSEVERVRADLGGTLATAPIDVYGVVTGCQDCPLRAHGVPTRDDGRTPVTSPVACALAIESAPQDAVLLWSRANL